METLKQRRDFLRVSASSFRYVSSGFILQALSVTTPSSCYGLTASRKVGNAVARNFAKRRLRVLVKKYLVPLALPQVHYVIVARPALLTLSFQALEEDFQKALNFLNARLRP